MRHTSPGRNFSYSVALPCVAPPWPRKEQWQRAPKGTGETQAESCC